MQLLFIILASIGIIKADTLKVVTTIPELAEIAKAIGKKDIKAESLLSGSEDPHFLEASPYFISKVSNADVFCQVGLELEIGWAPKVIQKSANKKIQPGAQGFCDASTYVTALDIPERPSDRSMGDVHKKGNPHYNLSPDQLIKASEKILEVLIAYNPKNSSLYTKNQIEFKNRMLELKQKIQDKLNQHNLKVIQYHKEFNYFFNSYSIKHQGSIEELPGVPPSSSRIAKVALKAKQQGIDLAVGSHYTPEKHLNKFSEISGISSIKLPALVNLNQNQYNTIEKLQHYITDQIINKAKGK
ncbi:MAG: metal ABC transporter substrate-binding protein [Bdellovibrionales bacterium]|nr:metal ABC transporter substrate-binding protein [Bdellovibrionales bacterium]